MKSEIALMVTVVSVALALPFLFALLHGGILIYQGDVPEGVEIIANATSDEIVGWTYKTISVAILVTIFSAIGLTSVVLILKKL
ncbi:MAG: hypothetical protein OEY88_08400 [Candidatus Bathyarchaeota archaeon]|nr:hypothetical protein [Candidatus Bathyarchaeota archaeon]